MAGRARGNIELKAAVYTVPAPPDRMMVASLDLDLLFD